MHFGHYARDDNLVNSDAKKCQQGSRRSLPPEIRYYFLILGLNYSGMENFKANGKDHSR